MRLSLLDLIEAKDKEYYDRIFDEYKTAFREQINYPRTDEEIRERLEYNLENDRDFKVDFVVNELNDDDLILNNLYEFTEFCSKNIERLL